MDKEELRNKVNEEYIYAFNFVERKREKRREDLETYVQESEKEKVNIHSIYSTVTTLMSIFYQNRITVKWQWRNRFDREIAGNTNKVAKYDYKEMDIEVLDYELQFNVFMKWVWVQILDWFDSMQILPKWKNIDPLACIFDPEWWPTIKNHRFFWIEWQISAYDAKQKWRKLEDLSSWEYTTQQNKQKIAEVRGYWYSTDETKNKMYDIYYHFNRSEDWTPILSVWGAWKSNLLSYKKLPAVSKLEKKDPYKIYFPIALKYYSYVPWDPLSISVPDLTRDKQSYYSQLFNAMLAAAIRNSLWDDRFVNTKKIKDLAWLKKPSIQWKLIPVNIWDNENISNVIYSIPKDNIWNLPFNVKTYLQEEMTLETGIDRNTSWVLSTQNSTLWEREMAQRNANIRFLLATKQWNWFEEFRWEFMWYRTYQANLWQTEKKTIFFNNTYSPKTYVFQKSDFIWEEPLRLELVNKAEREQEINSRKADRVQLLPQLIAWAKSNDEKVMLYRELLEAQWEDEDYIMDLFPLTWTELRAYDMLQLLEENDMDWAIITDMNEPHEVYIRIFHTSEPTRARDIALDQRYKAIIQRDWWIISNMQNWAEQAAQNTSTAQLTNNAIQQSKQVASTQDIL